MVMPRYPMAPKMPLPPAQVRTLPPAGPRNRRNAPAPSFTVPPAGAVPVGVAQPTIGSVGTPAGTAFDFFGGPAASGYDPGAFNSDVYSEVGGPLGDLGYDNLDAPAMVMEDPTFMLPGLFPGLDPMGAGMGQLAGALGDNPLALFYAMGADFGAGGDEFAGFYSDAMGQAAGGGVMLDVGGVIDALRNLDPNSTLGQALQHQPGAAAGIIQAAIGQAAKQSLNPLSAGILNNALSAAFLPMASEMMRLSPEENVPGAVDPMAALNAGLGRLGF